MTDELYRCVQCGAESFSSVFVWNGVNYDGLADLELHMRDDGLTPEEINQAFLDYVEEHYKCDTCGAFDCAVFVTSTDQ